ncbi:MAG: hypothetical protein KF773_03305 [Deltaproteobacteria bacterium]|nr:hypothetical protein [Deltaproteobacteria bacterium]
MRERDTAWLHLEGKDRPAVVLEVESDLVRVAYGTSEAHEWPRVEVHAETRQGRAFPLTETTHFYGANTQWEQPRALRPGAKPCAWELLFAIRRVVEEYDLRVTPFD